MNARTVRPVMRLAVVTLSASGRRLFIENEADDVLRTNLAQYIFGSLP